MFGALEAATVPRSAKSRTAFRDKLSFNRVHKSFNVVNGVTAPLSNTVFGVF